MSTAPIATADGRQALSSARASAALEVCPDGILVVSDENEILQVNLAAARMLGRDRDGLVGAVITEFIDPTSEVVVAAEALFASPDAPVSVPLGVLPFERDDGRTLHLDVTVARTGAGSPGEFTIFVGDVTEIEIDRVKHRHTADRYQSIVQHSQVALILCADPIRESVLISGESCLGYPAHTPLPRGIRALVHPEDAAEADSFIEMLKAADPYYTSSRDLRLRAADGRWLTCYVVGENLRHDPAVRGVVFRVSDITQQRAKETQVESHITRLQMLIDNLGSAIMLESQDRRMLVANEAFATMFQLPLPTSELVGLDCRPAGQSVKAIFADPEGFINGIHERMADYVPVLGERMERDYLPLTAESGPAGHMWAYRNVTQQIRQTQLLEDQNRSLAELARLKNEFVARVSHELRSPLTSVVSFSELLREATQGSLPADQAEFLEIVSRNSQRLLRLVEDLLLLARLESHTLPLSLEPVDLPTVVAQVAQELSPRAEEGGITLEVTDEDGPAALADELRIQQVVANLLSNAIKYTPEGGTITVSTLPDHATGRWHLTVADTGIGIPPQDLPHIFEPFFRARQSGTQPAGAGLGLAISFPIIHEHGGSIAVESTPDSGTRVRVELPFEVA